MEGAVGEEEAAAAVEEEEEEEEEKEVGAWDLRTFYLMTTV